MRCMTAPLQLRGAHFRTPLVCPQSLHAQLLVKRPRRPAVSTFFYFFPVVVDLVMLSGCKGLTAMRISASSQPPSPSREPLPVTPPTSNPNPSSQPPLLTPATSSSPGALPHCQSGLIALSCLGKSKQVAHCVHPLSNLHSSSRIFRG